MRQLSYLEWIFDLDRQFKNREFALWGQGDDKPATGNEAFDILDDFHKGQCAMCGGRGDLVLDHCHESDLVRAYLCTSCNVQEGRGGNTSFAIYRRFYPTKLLNIELHYSDYSSWGNTLYNEDKFMTKESKQFDGWSDDRCLKVYADYLVGRVNLRWMPDHEFRRFLRRATELLTADIDQLTKVEG